MQRFVNIPTVLHEKLQEILRVLRDGNVDILAHKMAHQETVVSALSILSLKSRLLPSNM